MGDRFRPKHAHIKKRSEIVEIIDCLCPVCGNGVDALTEEAISINSAMESLNLEVGSMVGFARFDVEQMETLKHEKRNLQKEISEINTQINEFESFNKKIKEYKDKRDSLGYLRAKIEIIVEQISNKIQITDFGEQGIINELKLLRESLTKYDFKTELAECQSKLNTWMNKIANNLDFEEQFLPAKLELDLNTLSIIHNDKKYGRIRLSDLGSGANWLAFHLSASLGFLKLFSYKNKSPVPNFLFIDQPSQVYFPRDVDSHDNDIKKVENIYIQIVKSLKEGRKESGKYSQVIVLDHADNLDLKEYRYKRYVRANWYEPAEALI